MIHLRQLVLSTLFLPAAARRSIHDGISQHGAQQLTYMRTQDLEASADRREEYAPRSLAGLFHPRGPQPGASHPPYGHAVGRRVANHPLLKATNDEVASSLDLGAASQQQGTLVTRVCDMPALQQVPALLRRPLASLAVRKGLPLIDSDNALREHILSGRVGHPLFVQRFASALDEALDLSPLVSESQQKALAQGVAAVLLTPSSATRDLVIGLDAKAIGLAPALRDKAARIELATSINRAIDLPLMDEDAEQVLFEQLVDSAAELVEQLLPGELQDALLKGSEQDVSRVRAILVERLKPQIVRRLPMALLTFVEDKFSSAKLTALPEQVAEAIVDATLKYIRNVRPDEMLSDAELSDRLELREAATAAEIARVEEEAASVLEELHAKLEQVRAQRYELEARRTMPHGEQ